jgi:chorismate synthase
VTGKGIEMNSEKLAGILGAIVAAAVLVIAIAYGPIGQIGKPQKPVQKAEQPAQSVAAPPATRGPVVREVPQ